jgi:chromosomal replication initiation ATPase DnaA
MTMTDDLVSLAVPNTFTRAWVRENYEGLLLDILLEVTGSRFQVRFGVLGVDACPQCRRVETLEGYGAVYRECSWRTGPS